MKLYFATIFIIALAASGCVTTTAQAPKTSDQSVAAAAGQSESEESPRMIRSAM